MGYKWLILFLLIFNVFEVSAQQLLVGPKISGGLTRPFYYKEKFKEINQARPGIGGDAGIIINYKVSDRFSWHTELLYTKKSRRIFNRDDPESTFIKEYQNYLEFPLLLRVSLPRGIMKLNFNIGPRVSYWLGGRGFYSFKASSEFGIERIDYSIEFNNPENDTDYYILNPNRLQLGIDTGLGVDFPIKQQRLFIELRYTFGHTHIANEETTKVNEPIEDPLQYSMHQLNLSFAFLFEFDLFEIRNKGQSNSDS